MKIDLVQDRNNNILDVYNENDLEEIFREGDKVKVISNDRKETYIGTLTHICLGFKKKYPNKISIFLLDNLSEEITYGNAYIWGESINSIEHLN